MLYLFYILYLKVKNIYFPDPVTLSGEGQYNLNSLKKFEVTPSFHGLDESTKECQTKSSFDNCTTNFYLDTVRKKCKCLPFTIYNLNEVFMQQTENLIFHNYLRLPFALRQRR